MTTEKDDKPDTEDAASSEAEPADSLLVDRDGDHEDAVADEPPAPATDPSGRGRRRLKIVGVAVLIAAAIAGGWALNQWRIEALGGGDAALQQAVAAQAERIAALDAKLAALESATRAQTDAAAALAAKVQANATALARIEGRPDPSPAATEALQALNRRVAALESAPPPADSAARLAELEQRLANLEGDSRADDLAARLDALQAQLAALAARPDDRPAAPAATAASPPIAAVPDLSPLRARLARLEAERAALSRLASRLEAQDGRIGDQAKALAALRGEVESERARIAGQLDKLATRDRAAAAVVALSDVRRGALSGGPYAAQMAALDSLAPDGNGEAMAILRRNAKSGIAALEDLRRDFAAQASELVRIAEQRADGDWLDRTGERLGRLVTVRRTGPVPGDRADAIVARAEHSLALGELAAAVAELETLSGGAAERAADWLSRAKARLAVLDALDTLQRQSVARSGGG